MQVFDVMTSPAISMTPGADVQQVIEVLESGARSMLIVDGYSIVGIISRRDLIGRFDISRKGFSGTPSAFRQEHR